MMNLEIFAKLDKDGNTGTDHLFMASPKDLAFIGATLAEIYEKNKRARSIDAVSKKFGDAADNKSAWVCLQKADCRTLVDAIEEHARGARKTTALAKLSAKLCTAVSVY